MESVAERGEEKEKKHGSWANLKGGGQLAAKAGNGAQMRGMVPGLGSVSGCPHNPTATSTRCVWTQVHAGVVAICSDQPVHDRCVVFDCTVEGGLYDHAQPYIRAALMMGVFSCVCSGVLWGRVGL